MTVSIYQLLEHGLSVDQIRTLNRRSRFPRCFGCGGVNHVARVEGRYVCPTPEGSVPNSVLFNIRYPIEVVQPPSGKGKGGGGKGRGRGGRAFGRGNGRGNNANNVNDIDAIAENLQALLLVEDENVTDQNQQDENVDTEYQVEDLFHTQIIDDDDAIGGVAVHW